MCLRGCSLLAGQVGNIEGSIGRGDSEKNSCFKDSSAVILFVGLYVKNLSVYQIVHASKNRKINIFGILQIITNMSGKIIMFKLPVIS